ncbi:MAG: Nif11-like leader peptide family natural product precursor [Desulfovibrio sp.]|nr:Nif11-like leader peptide family natural product precursor [Desulfovibrio sp.]
MAMDNVRRLMLAIRTDADLKHALAKAPDQAAREAILRERGMHFTHDDFDAIIDHLHVQCQTHEEAERFHQFRLWWDFLRRT